MALGRSTPDVLTLVHVVLDVWPPDGVTGASLNAHTASERIPSTHLEATGAGA